MVSLSDMADAAQDTTDEVVITSATFVDLSQLSACQDYSKSSGPMTVLGGVSLSTRNKQL